MARDAVKVVHVPESYREAFGIVLRDACKAKGWNQEETAWRMGCVQSAVSRYWSGKYTPDIIALRMAFSSTEIFGMLNEATWLFPVPEPKPRCTKALPAGQCARHGGHTGQHSPKGPCATPPSEHSASPDGSNRQTS
jgi:hypothetical protein